MSSPPILPYEATPASWAPYNPDFPQVAARLAELIQGAAPFARVEHIGSTAVPGCGGKGIVDLMLLYPAGRLADARAALDSLGFQRQSNRDPFPEERPMRTGAIEHGGRVYRVHVHVIREDDPEAGELLGFRDRLRADPSLLDAYTREKQRILGAGLTDSVDYAEAKTDFIRRSLGEPEGSG